MKSFSDEAIRRIARNTTASEKRLMSSKPRARSRLQTNHGSYIVKTPSGGIPARSGTTLGSATCTVQDVSTATMSDGISETVLNLSDTAIAGSTYVMATRDRQGNYVVEAADSETKNVARAQHSQSLTNPRNWDYFTTTDKSFCELVNGVVQLRRRAMIHIDGTHTYKPNISDHKYPAVYEPLTNGEPVTDIGKVMKMWKSSGTKTFFNAAFFGVAPFSYALPDRWSTFSGEAFRNIGVIGIATLTPSIFHFSFSRPFFAEVPSVFTWNGTVSGVPFSGFDVDKLELNITFEEM